MNKGTCVESDTLSKTNTCDEGTSVGTYVAAGAVVVTVAGSGIGALLYFKSAA